MSTALFFPYPVGAGHVGRCLAAALALQEKGFDCLFAHDPAGGLCERAGFRTLSDPPPYRRPSPAGASGYLASPSMDSALAATGLYRPRRLREWVERDRRLISQVRPDVVVADLQVTALLAARLERCPAVSVCDGDFLATGWNAWMPWLHDPEGLVSPYPSVLPAVNDLCAGTGLPDLADASELAWADATLVASTPLIDPLPEAARRRSPGPAHVGPLIWEPAPDGDDPLAPLPDTSGLKVYVTLGSGEVALGDLDHLLGGLVTELGATVLFSGGSPHRLDSAYPGRLFRTGFGGLRAALDWCDVVVCHGGNGTVLAALASGTPVCVLPALGENEANGRYLVDRVGAGTLARWSEQDPVTGRLVVRHGTFPEAGRGDLRQSLVETVAAIADPDRGHVQRARSIARALTEFSERNATALVDAVEGVMS